jgi:hypothetical protein
VHSTLYSTSYTMRSGPGSHEAPALPFAPMLRSAWKSNSRKFTVANGSSMQRQPHDKRPCSTPLGSKRSDLVAVVAPFCIKGLRLVTVQLPEKFLGRRIAAIGQCEGNANFACREF